MVVPSISPPEMSMSSLSWVAIVPRPKAVLAADAEVELVPPLASDMGVDMVTVGLAIKFKVGGLNSTPVATVAPSVTVAVIVPMLFDVPWGSVLTASLNQTVTKGRSSRSHVQLNGTRVSRSLD